MNMKVAFSSLFFILKFHAPDSQKIGNSTLSLRKYYCIKENCGKNAECKLTDDGGFCVCKCGFSGDPYEGCELTDPKTVLLIKVGQILPIKLKFRPDVSMVYKELVKKSNFFYFEAFIEDILRRWGAYIPGTFSVIYFEYASNFNSFQI